MSIKALMISLRGGLTLAFLVGSASGAIINTDTVLGPDHTCPDQTITVIDGVRPPTLLTVLEGALVGDAFLGTNVPIGIDAYGQSQIEMLGGIVRGGQQSVLLHENSSFRMRVGEIHTGPVEARDATSVFIEGGSVGAVFGFASSHIRINSPRDEEDNVVRTFGNLHAVIEGLDEFLLEAADASTVVVKGGEFHQIFATDNSRILVDGGYFSDTSPRAYDNAVVDVWSIGAIAEEPITASGRGIVNIYGTNLRFDVLDDHGTLIPFVAGNLADGDPFSAEYRIFDQGHIILHKVPEPGTWGLLAVGAGALLLGRLVGAAG